jgi:hypothetical protein
MLVVTCIIFLTLDTVILGHLTMIHCDLFIVIDLAFSIRWVGRIV